MEFFVRKKIDPVILLSPMAISKMDFLVSIAKKEVGWLGSVEEKQPFHYFIDDIHLFKQEVTGAETDIDATALGEFFSDHIDIADSIRFWGHSHVNMGVSPSGQDLKQIEELQGNGCPFFIMGIFNKKRESRFDIYTDEYIFKNVEWRPFVDKVNMTSLQAEFDAKVKDKTYVTNNYNKGGKGYYNSGGGYYNGGNGFGFDNNKNYYGGDVYDTDTKETTTNTGKSTAPTGHKKTSGNVRSLKSDAKGGRNWLWGNGKQDNNEPSKTGNEKSKNLGQGQDRGTQHPKSVLLTGPDKSAKGASA